MVEAEQQLAKDRKEWRALVHMKMINFHVVIFAWLLSFGPPSHNLVTYHLEKDGMPLHDAVGVNCKKGTTTDMKAQTPSIRDKGCMLDTHRA